MNAVLWAKRGRDEHFSCVGSSTADSVARGRDWRRAATNGAIRNLLRSRATRAGFHPLFFGFRTRARDRVKPKPTAERAQFGGPIGGGACRWPLWKLRRPRAHMFWAEQKEMLRSGRRCSLLGQQQKLPAQRWAARPN